VSDQRIVLATRNPGKLVELSRILDGSGLSPVGLDAFPRIGEIIESGATFRENALLKAHGVAAATGLLAVADDSGLVVPALGGMPGVLSARWSGRHGDDAANLALVLAQLDAVPDERRGASFVCAAAAATPDGAERVVEASIEGTLLRASRGSGGFGYDPIFVPLGETRTTAELEPAAKDAVSHRGQAFRAIVPLVLELLS
jgi:XTP/dITP diphosphohydrolase